jgi:hypothetical protein
MSDMSLWVAVPLAVGSFIFLAASVAGIRHGFQGIQDWNQSVRELKSLGLTKISVNRIPLILSAISCGLGFSLIAAAATLWTRWKVALPLGSLEALAVIGLATGRIRVIGQLTDDPRDADEQGLGP